MVIHVLPVVQEVECLIFVPHITLGNSDVIGCCMVVMFNVYYILIFSIHFTSCIYLYISFLLFN